MDFDFDRLDEKLKKYIDAKRYMHTKGVEMTAACMAMKFGYESGLRGDEQTDFIRRCRLAGLLHDNAKNLSDEDMLAACIKHNIPMTAIEKENPFLLHGKVGAYYLKKRYDIEDSEIASAIACHTTGKPGMTLLEKILFIADYVEPGRNKQANLDLIRFLAMTDLDTCIYKIADDTLNYLNHKKKAVVIDENTLATRDYYKKLADMKLLDN